MKKLLFFCFVLLNFLVINGQETAQTIGGTTTQANKVKGRLYIDSVAYLPVRDTNFTPLRKFAITMRPQDSLVYICRSITADKKWYLFGTGSGSGSSISQLGTAGALCLTRLNDSTYTVDTACLAATFLRIKDTAYAAGATTRARLQHVVDSINAVLNTKQATLVSGTNIKTVNGNSLLGSGDLTISGGTPIKPTGWCLQVDKDDVKSSNIAIFDAVEVGREYGKFFAAFKAQPFDSCEYFESTGYSGEHIRLLGLNGTTSGKLMFQGNMWFNGSNVGGFYGQDTIKTGTKHSFGYGYDGAYMFTMLDGVPSRRFAYTGKRSILSSPGSTGDYFFGSDHSRADARIWEIIVYETGDDTPPVTSSAPMAAKSIQSSNANPIIHYDLTTPSNHIINRGGGDAGHKMDGRLNSGANYSPFINGGSENPAYFPQWVQEDYGPNEYTGSAPVIASGSVVSETFHRRDSVPEFTRSGVPSLWQTEGGSDGVLTWQMQNTSAAYYAGIIGTWAYFAAANYAYVVPTTQTDSVIVRKASDLSEKNFSVIVRRQDIDDYLEFYVSNGFGYLRQFVAGTPTAKGDFTMPADWNTLTVVTAPGNLARVYTDATLRINNADISDGATTAKGIGFGHNSCYERTSAFTAYKRY